VSNFEQIAAGFNIKGKLNRTIAHVARSGAFLGLGGRNHPQGPDRRTGGPGRQAEEGFPLIQAKARKLVEHPLRGIRMDWIILNDQASTVIVDTAPVIPSCSRSQDKVASARSEQ
jgi:hypothetical protein